MLLKQLRTKRRTTPRPTSRYVSRTQTSQILENGSWLDSWTAQAGAQTKKADIETGEDQKGA
jgi:hypothetical protein